MPNLADRVGANQLAGPLAVRLITELVVDPRKPVGTLFGCCHHLRRFERIQRHRFLAQHVLSRLERRNRVPRMRIGGGRYHDEVHIRRARYLRSVGEDSQPEFAGDGFRVGAMPARDRGGFRTRYEREGRDLHPPRESGPDESDTNVVRWTHGLVWAQDTLSDGSGSGTSWYSMRVGVRIAFSIPDPWICPPIVAPSRRSWTEPVSKKNACPTSLSRYRTATIAPGVVVSPGMTIG